MKYRIAIDGACRRNGKPDCVSAGGLLLQRFSDEGVLESSFTIGVTEKKSTNQRGEMLALIKALSILVDVCGLDDEATIVTDSEYLFNAMTKGWVSSWEAKGYKTAEGNDVKNQDLWRKIYILSQEIVGPVQFYHIKGHLIPFGKVTGEKLLNYDPTAQVFCEAFGENYTAKLPTKADEFIKANELSTRNNGFPFDPETMKEFVTINAVADFVAGIYVARADRDAQS